jgi:hypothetical protein
LPKDGIGAQLERGALGLALPALAGLMRLLLGWPGGAGGAAPMVKPAPSPAAAAGAADGAAAALPKLKFSPAARF